MTISESKFKCKVSGHAADTLKVLDFEYSSSLSQPYSCKVNFIAADPSLDCWSFINKHAYLSIQIKNSSEIQYISGVVSKFLQMGQVGDHYTYSIVIEPQITQLKNQELTDVFLDMSIPNIVMKYLQDYGIAFKDDLAETYAEKTFVCQYQETVYDFIFRWLEYEGIYYYFKHGKKQETLVLTDKYTTHSSHKGLPSLHYLQNKKTPEQGINNAEAFSSHINNVAKDLQLKGYNYNNNTQEILVDEEISKHGIGKIEIFDENVDSEDDAKMMAKVRAQGISCMAQVFSGKTQASCVTPGYTFKLKDHFNKDYNQSYLIFETQLHGSQRKTVLSKFCNINDDDDSSGISFSTYFKAIQSKTQFRPAQLLPPKKINGVIPAIIDAETSGETPQLDEQGRYKIRFLYSDKSEGQSSDWIRKMESYLGENYGRHLPALKGAEACISFQFGNPDRPIIVGMLQNSSNPNTVTSENATDVVVLETPAGNKITASDEVGKEYVKLETPFGDTKSVMGYNSDEDEQSWDAKAWVWAAHKPPDPKDCSLWVESKKDRAFQVLANSYFYTKGNNFAVTYGDSYTAKMGFNDTTMTFGLSQEDISMVGSKNSVTVSGVNLDCKAGGLDISASYTTTKMEFSYVNFKIDCVKEGNSYDWLGGDKTITVKGNLTTSVIKDITTTTAGNISTIAQNNIITFANGDIETNTSANIIDAANKITQTADEEVKLECGESSIELTQGSIVLKSGGTQIIISAAGISTNGRVQTG